MNKGKEFYVGNKLNKGKKNKKSNKEKKKLRN